MCVFSSILDKENISSSDINDLNMIIYLDDFREIDNADRDFNDHTTSKGIVSVQHKYIHTDTKSN